MKTRRCSVCRLKVPSESAVIGSLKAFCSMEHLIEYSRSDAGRKTVKKAVQRTVRAEKKLAVEKLKTRSDYTKEAQIAFNAYVRERDNSRQCISCETHLNQTGALGGSYDCGHYRSVGSAPHLRFDLHNAHGQCKKCNKYKSGNVADYRIKLLRKIGGARLEALECDQIQRKYTVPDLQRIKIIFTTKLKRLKSKNGKS